MSSPNPRRRWHLSYAMTAAYIVSVLAVFAIINVLSPEQQTAAILLALACLLIITGAGLIALYTFISDYHHNRRDHPKPPQT